jgi:hypothetical protein
VETHREGLLSAGRGRRSPWQGIDAAVAAEDADDISSPHELLQIKGGASAAVRTAPVAGERPEKHLSRLPSSP